MKPRFSLQSFLWLTVVGILLAWWADHPRLGRLVKVHAIDAEWARYREAEAKARFEGNLER